jgi:phosphotransferase system  glucose/maltose/N-acetylglucosamine-specific IIC component
MAGIIMFLVNMRTHYRLYHWVFVLSYYLKVWLGLGVSIVCVTAILILILRFSSHLPENFDSNTQVESNSNDNLEGQDGRHPVVKNQPEKPYLYVIGNLLSQGFSYWLL